MRVVLGDAEDGDPRALPGEHPPVRGDPEPLRLQVLGRKVGLDGQVAAAAADHHDRAVGEGAVEHRLPTPAHSHPEVA